MDHQAENILDCLPHRPPFLFITEQVHVDTDSSGHAIWCVDGSEAFFAGHFPDHPIVPGVLIGEALAQLSGMVAVVKYQAMNRPPSDREAPLGKLAHIDLRFSDSVTPPAKIHLSSRIRCTFGDLIQFDVQAAVNDKRITHGTLTLSLPSLTTNSAATST